MSVLTMLASTAAACRCGLAGVAQLRRHHSLQGVPHRRGRAHSLINGAGLRRSQLHSDFFKLDSTGSIFCQGNRIKLWPRQGFHEGNLVKSLHGIDVS